MTALDYRPAPPAADNCCPYCHQLMPGERRRSAFGLTPKEREALEFIKAFIGQRQYSPSYQEIADGLGLASKSNVHRLILALTERGYIRRYRHGHARSLALTEDGAL